MRRESKPTINDVARLAGVSKKTVSRVINRSPLLNVETRARVEQVIADLGYVPSSHARALALGSNFLVGMLHDNPNAQTVMNVQAGMLEAVRGTEFELLVRPVDRASPTMLADVRDFLERQRPYGVVIVPPVSENDQLAELCETLGCRYVRMGSVALDTPEHSVASNDREMVVEAVRHLVGLGHRRIGLIAGPAGFRSACERRRGFEQALAEAGLPPGPVAEGDYRFESGLAAAAHLLDGASRPTAIFASNDEMAAGALHAAHMQGLSVPEDLSVIGFDDGPIAAHVWPPLTTVHWPVAAMARAATRKLLADYGGGDRPPPEPAMLPSTLVHRASVAPPRGA